MGIINQAQIRDNILNFLALIKFSAAHHGVGHATFNEYFFKHAGLGIGTIQHGHVAQLCALLELQLLHALNNKARFIAFIHRLIIGNLRAHAIIGPQILRLAARVIFNHRIGSIQNHLCAAVVLLQLHQLGLGIILFKVQNIANIRPAPAVNALVRIAHHAQIAVLAGQKLCQKILHMVGILILVHHDVIKFILIFFPCLGNLLQEAQR